MTWRTNPKLPQGTVIFEGKGYCRGDKVHLTKPKYVPGMYTVTKVSKQPGGLDRITAMKDRRP